MTYDNLTNFDRHVLAQGAAARYFGDPERRQANSETKSSVSDNFFGGYRNNVPQDSDEDLYKEYLINQLRRTTPGERPLMSKEEFLSSLQSDKNALGSFYTTNAYNAERNTAIPAFLGNAANMTVEEIENGSATENNTVSEDRPNTTSRRFRLPKLTKLGKIILSVYIIMLAAIASILVVSNTSVTAPDFHESANASMGVEAEQNPSTIRAMTIEDEEDSSGNNWFDKLCDSLNK